MKCDGGDEVEGVMEEVGESGEAGKGGGEGVRGEDVALEPGEGVGPEGRDARDSEQSPDQQSSSPPEQPEILVECYTLWASGSEPTIHMYTCAHKITLGWLALARPIIPLHTHRMNVKHCE